MHKYLTALLLSSLLSADTFFVADLAQGLKKSEFNEMGQLTMPPKKASQGIYKDRENVYLYAFNETNSINDEFVYRPRNKAEMQYKSANKKFLKFFKQVKKAGVKKHKNVTANIIFLVDTSGSMKTNDVIGQVKETMRYLVNAKSRRAEVAIVTFDGKKGMRESKKARIVQGFSHSKVEILNSIKKIKASHYDTFLGAGLTKVQSLLPRSKENTLVLLFTDGTEVNDEKKALHIIDTFKKSRVKLKVVAVGGADVAMLKRFSTTGYLFNATSSDLKKMAYGISVGSDEIFLRLNNFLDNVPPLTANDRLIIYSSMMNVDDENDFFIVPNIASEQFYKEVQKINAARAVKLKLNGAKVYVRLLGKMNASKEHSLRQFWEHYFKESGGELHFFSNAKLSKRKLQ